MSEYTMELNEVIAELQKQNKTLFDIDYELPDFMNKEELQNQFISHYYFREIGVETISRFLQRFHTKWLEKLQEYNLKFQLVHDKLSSGSALNTYEDNLKDTNTFKATPMSAIQEGRNYNTSVTELDGKHSGYSIANSNVFKNISSIIGEHIEVVNSFIDEFENLFMGVL